MARLVRRKDQDDSFDIEFWERVGVSGKLVAAWQMVTDLHNWNANYGPQQRLRKSHTLLKQRRG